MTAYKTQGFPDIARSKSISSVCIRVLIYFDENDGKTNEDNSLSRQRS